MSQTSGPVLVSQSQAYSSLLMFPTPDVRLGVSLLGDGRRALLGEMIALVKGRPGPQVESAQLE